MSTSLRIGFLPLVDAALLVAAREEGFAEAEGLSVDLVRDVSWANLRDRLAVGMLDAAQMLAPAAIASTLGLGHLTVPMAAPVMLSRNGNAITLSTRLFAAMAEAAEGDIADVAVSARAFAAVTAARLARGEGPPVLATVFPFSTHALLVEAWLRRAGLRAGEDIPTVVLPPQLMAASLANGQIDGFCAGAPWNVLAVEAGHGAVAALGLDLIADAPEKLLVFPAAEIDRRADTALALARAVLAAARWAQAPDHRARLAVHMAGSAYLDMPAVRIEAILAGRIALGAGRPPRLAPAYLRIDPAALAPGAEVADRLIDAMVAAGQMQDGPAARALARGVFREDLHRLAT
ncbi:ABC transporter substrate-binding protein [Labrys wisconsinensis]|uniref:NitT/TauT family transport system ATP-binding protein n=1 Tax=Labrys wisconsinensis TaxID=425677 RepID=A0ABU0J3W3_9HYPH|nr:ABC transporter substrate-binding protein [Labrys wisconsinensis]MDQ0468103.1 NitT/TauT family transport system ATP-binding protein [Labrys wisconsinensis]